MIGQMRFSMRGLQLVLTTIYLPFILSHPISAQEKDEDNWINAGPTSTSENAYIKKIRKLGSGEFSYLNHDNNLVLVRCAGSKTKVRYWYLANINNSETDRLSEKMQWHIPIQNTKYSIESDYICRINNHSK